MSVDALKTGVTRGTVAQEMAMNGYFQCVCGKMHGMWSAAVCPCGEPFPMECRYEVCR